MAGARHPTLGRPLRRNVYQPMLELIDELRRRDFTVSIVTGGGTEFVRAVSQQLYGVPPEAVVGTLIDYDSADGGDGGTRLAPDRPARRRGQRGRRQGEQHPDPAGPPPDPRRRATPAATGRCSSGRRRRRRRPRPPGRPRRRRSASSPTSAAPRPSPSPSRSPTSAPDRLDGGQHGERLGDRLRRPALTARGQVRASVCRAVQQARADSARRLRLRSLPPLVPEREEHDGDRHRRDQPEMTKEARGLAQREPDLVGQPAGVHAPEHAADRRTTGRSVGRGSRTGPWWR